MVRNLGPQPRPLAPRLSDALVRLVRRQHRDPPGAAYALGPADSWCFSEGAHTPLLHEGGERQRRIAQEWFPHSPFLLTRPLRTRSPTSRPRFYGSLASGRPPSAFWGDRRLLFGRREKEERISPPHECPLSPCVCFLEHQPLWGAVGIVDLELADPRFYLFLI